MLFSESFRAASDWYHQERYDAAAETFKSEKERIERARSESEGIHTHVDEIVMHAFQRLIDLSEARSYTKDFDAFYALVGRALQQADASQTS